MAVAQPQQTWRQVLDRTALVHVPQEGRPYGGGQVKEALLRAKVAPAQVELVGPLEGGRTWQVRFATEAALARCMNNSPFLMVQTPRGSFQCPIGRWYDTLRVLRVHWLPAWVPDDVLCDVLGQFGTVKNVLHESNAEGFVALTGTQLVTISLTADVDAVPDKVTIAFGGAEAQVMLTVLGERPRCHRCHIRGHVRRRCEATCLKCGSEHHTDREHFLHQPPVGMASNISKARERAREAGPDPFPPLPNRIEGHQGKDPFFPDFLISQDSAAPESSIEMEFGEGTPPPGQKSRDPTPTRWDEEPKESEASPEATVGPSDKPPIDQEPPPVPPYAALSKQAPTGPDPPADPPVDPPADPPADPVVPTPKPRRETRTSRSRVRRPSSSHSRSRSRSPLPHKEAPNGQEPHSD